MINNLYPLITLALFFSFKTFLAGEAEEFKRDYTASTSRVISCHIGEEDPIVSISPSKHYGYYHNKDLVDNVLVCLDSNNKLFTCYSGYTMVDHWKLSRGNYRTEPVIKKKLNVLTETSPYSKIEYKFNDVPELCNEYPVNDIARRKNNYYVAHQNNVYIYQSNNAYIVSPTLLNIHHLKGSLEAQGVIKKIFIDNNDNVIAVSSYGSILKNSCLVSSSKEQAMTLLSQSFPRREKLHSIAYNEQNNIMLLGGHNFIHIVQLGDSIKSFRIPVNQLRINTIDTNDNYVLLSDMVQNQNPIKKHYHEGHSAYSNCCLERKTPYSSLPDCNSCQNAKEEWEQNKKLWENEIIDMPQQRVPRNKISDYTHKKFLEYDVPAPKACTHKKTPDAWKNLIISCKTKTVLLLSFSKLMKAITNKPTDNLTLSDFVEHRSEHEYLAEKHLLTHAFLTNDFLFTGRNGKNMTHDTYLYKTPLNNLNTIPSLLYRKNESDYASGNICNEDYNYRQLVQICKNPDNTTIAVTIIATPCSKWCQGGCSSEEHWRLRLSNIVLLTKNIHENSQFYSLIRPLHRTFHYLKNNSSLILARTGCFLLFAYCIRSFFN